MSAPRRATPKRSRVPRSSWDRLWKPPGPLRLQDGGDLVGLADRRLQRRRHALVRDDGGVLGDRADRPGHQPADDGGQHQGEQQQPAAQPDDPLAVLGGGGMDDRHRYVGREQPAGERRVLGGAERLHAFDVDGGEGLGAFETLRAQLSGSLRPTKSRWRCRRAMMVPVRSLMPVFHSAGRFWLSIVSRNCSGSSDMCRNPSSLPSPPVTGTVRVMTCRPAMRPVIRSDT